MIKSIIFDLGGVLVPEKSIVIETEVAKFFKINHAKINQLIKELNPKLTTGEIKLIDFYSKLVKGSKKDINPEDLLQKHIEIYKDTSTKQDQEVLSLIKWLKTKYIVACLTNTEIEIAEFNRKNGLFDYFDKAYLSTDRGLRKPLPEIYLRVLDDLKCHANETLFIDDKLENVNGAKKAGLNAILFLNVKQLKKEMASFSVNVD